MSFWHGFKHDKQCNTISSCLNNSGHKLPHCTVIMLISAVSLCSFLFPTFFSLLLQDILKAKCINSNFKSTFPWVLYAKKGRTSILNLRDGQKNYVASFFNLVRPFWNIRHNVSMNTGKEDLKNGRKHNPEKLPISIFQFKTSRSILSSFLLNKIARSKKLLEKTSCLLIY